MYGSGGWAKVSDGKGTFLAQDCFLPSVVPITSAGARAASIERSKPIGSLSLFLSSFTKIHTYIYIYIFRKETSYRELGI